MKTERFLNYMSIFGYVCGYLHMTVGVCDGQKRVLDPLLGCILGLGISQHLHTSFWPPSMYPGHGPKGNWGIVILMPIFFS